jgi:hypothetical protein
MRLASLLLVLLGGCVTSRVDSETTREVVLNHVGGSYGTAGPFSNQAKKEFVVLSPKDQQEASALIDRGAVAFLVFEAGNSTAVRIVLVHKGRVVGDFRSVPADPPQSPAPAPAPGAVTPRATR